MDYLHVQADNPWYNYYLSPAKYVYWFNSERQENILTKLKNCWLRHKVSTQTNMYCSPLFGPRREKTCLRGVRQSEFQTSLLVFHLQQVYIWCFLKSEFQRRWSDCAVAQAGLRLCCSQTPEDRFSRDEAHLPFFYCAWSIKENIMTCPNCRQELRDFTVFNIGKSTFLVNDQGR